MPFFENELLKCCPQFVNLLKPMYLNYNAKHFMVDKDDSITQNDKLITGCIQVNRKSKLDSIMQQN